LRLAKYSVVELRLYCTVVCSRQSDRRFVLWHWSAGSECRRTWSYQTPLLCMITTRPTTASRDIKRTHG